MELLPRIDNSQLICLVEFIDVKLRKDIGDNTVTQRKKAVYTFHAICYPYIFAS